MSPTHLISPYQFSCSWLPEFSCSFDLIAWDCLSSILPPPENWKLYPTKHLVCFLMNWWLSTLFQTTGAWSVTVLHTSCILFTFLFSFYPRPVPLSSSLPFLPLSTSFSLCSHHHISYFTFRYHIPPSCHWSPPSAMQIPYKLSPDSHPEGFLWTAHPTIPFSMVNQFCFLFLMAASCIQLFKPGKAVPFCPSFHTPAFISTVVS